jgi:hypothetical protein
MPKPRAMPDQIRALRGLFKLKPGEKPVTQELLEDRAEDLRIEEAKWTRFEKRITKQGGG